MDGQARVVSSQSSTPSHTPVQKIRSLLLLLFSGVAAALFIVTGLVYYYGPTGEYTVGNVLLAPETLKELSYPEDRPGGGKARMVFHSVQVKRYFAAERRWSSTELTPEQYARFYAYVRGSSSLPADDPAALDAFFRGPELRLLIHVQPSNASDAPTTFQELHVAPGGEYFRVELHQQDPQQRWAYFRRSGVAAQLMQATQEQ